MEERRQRGKARVQDIDLVGEANTLIQTFRNSQNLQEKAEAARQLQMMQKMNTGDKEFKSFMGQFSKALKLDEWLKLYNYSQNLREISRSARTYLGQEEGGNPARSLDELSTSDDVDEQAQEIARRFETYLPKFQELKGSQGQTKKTVKHHSGQGTVTVYKSGEGYDKDTVRDGDDNVILKPSGGDDPRLMTMVVANMETFLKGTETDRTGFAVMMQMLDHSPSETTLKMTQEFMGRARQIDPVRFNNMMRGGITEYQRDLGEKKDRDEVDKSEFKQKEKGTKQVKKDWGIKM